MGRCDSPTGGAMRFNPLAMRSRRPNSPFHFVSAARSDVGGARKLNEDACLDRPDVGLWVVADGMGGHDAGDHASQLIVEAMRGVRPPDSAPALLADVRTRMDEVHARLLNDANRLGPGRVIGSTAVLLLAFGGHYAGLWVGDSRLYQLRNGRFTQLSRDHTHYEEMVDAGIVTAEAGRSHPQANVLTRAVGYAELKLDKVRGPIQADDVFLLCSDGLVKFVGDDEIAEILGRQSPEEATKTLVDLTLVRGASDNVTVVVVRCDPTR